MSVDLKYVDEAVERIGRAPDAVIPILQALQDHYGYLPEEALRRVCATTQITPAAISGVSTFYDMFRHEPSGKHIVHVCHGTACHVGGAERVEDALRRHLRIPEGSDTDAERRFTIERVACLGCCTLAPVVRIEEETIGYATAEKVPGAIRDFLASRQAAGCRQASRQRPRAEQWRRRDQGLPRLVLPGERNGSGLSRLAAEPGAERREGHRETRRLRRRLLSDADGRGRRAGQVERDLRRAERGPGRRAGAEALPPARPRAPRVAALDAGPGWPAGGRRSGRAGS